MKISDIEPRAVMRYFEEICAIPRGSGNTKGISDYCVKFAQRHGFKYIQDEYNNVIIFCPPSEGYEKSAPVIIQGHMDMVCDSAPDRRADFENEGVEPVVDGDFIRANGTTLGADDGIAIAYALAIMSDETAAHPPIEAVFTVDEETGMTGAVGIDVSMLKGRIMLNIDSEEEGVLTVSCAGGRGAECIFPIQREAAAGKQYRISVEGLAGGHSGTEIDKGRANSNVLMGRILYALRDKINLVSLSGGTKGNAIPRSTRAVVIADESIEDRVKEYEAAFRNEYSVSDSGVRVICEYEGEGTQNAVCRNKTREMAAFLISAPNGVYAMSADIKGLVQTSLNMGILRLEEDKLRAVYTLRSSVGTQKQWLSDMLGAAAEAHGGYAEFSGDYSEWEYRRESRLRPLMVQTYRDMYGAEPKTEAIHAGVECGIFAGKLQGLDCVSFGPDLEEIHTARERMNIASVRRVWEYIREILRRLK